MKKIIIFLLLVMVYSASTAREPEYKDKLYYTCKVWGFVKYFHSEVSRCKIDWNEILDITLPKVKSAATKEDFNNVLMEMLGKAGPMKIATTPSPDTLDPELTRNLDFSWFEDEMIRSDVREILIEIRDNFRPHTICWVKRGSVNGSGFLNYPYDNPMVKSNFHDFFPDEFTRLAVIFRAWNILNYYNPNKYILDMPWDSTLYMYMDDIINAENYVDYYMALLKIASNLDDVHTEGLSFCSGWDRDYKPKILLRHTDEGYFVEKSAYEEFSRGDIIKSVNGKPVKHWEDSLKQIISAGNTNVFRREISQQLLRGTTGTKFDIDCVDPAGKEKSATVYGYSYCNHGWFYYVPNEDMRDVEWLKFDCNVGYVHMGNLSPSHVTTMYHDLRNTDAIIFDVRNYPDGTAPGVARMLMPESKPCVKWMAPETNYPGTFYYDIDSSGLDDNTDYYKGKIILIVNQKTQSHAEFSCMILEAFPNTTIVGNPTAGADGNVTSFSLSYDIRLGFSGLGVFYPDGRQTQRIGIVPDSVVYPTAEALRNGRDELLEKALEIAGCDINSIKVEINPPDEIRLFPNPADKHIKISGFSGKISIINSLGIKIWEGTFNDEIIIPVKDFPAGIYYIITGNEQQIKVKKIIVLH